MHTSRKHRVSTSNITNIPAVYFTDNHFHVAETNGDQSLAEKEAIVNG